MKLIEHEALKLTGCPDFRFVLIFKTYADVLNLDINAFVLDFLVFPTNPPVKNKIS